MRGAEYVVFLKSDKIATNGFRVVEAKKIFLRELAVELNDLLLSVRVAIEIGLALV